MQLPGHCFCRNQKGEEDLDVELLSLPASMHTVCDYGSHEMLHDFDPTDAASKLLFLIQEKQK